MNQELISVIVPAYNCAPWLKACLESILAQTHQNLELVVVDDGSADQTWEVLSDLAGKDSRIRPIRQKNGGVTAARLRGVAEAAGQWIGFVDGDDVLEPQMYERLLKNALETGADISHCGFQVIHPDGSILYLQGTGMLRVQDKITGLRDLLEERIVEPSLCTKLFRRQLFEGLGEKMDRTLKNNEDMLMNYYLFSGAERSVFEDVCFYHYMIHPGSASRRRLTEYLIFDPIRVRQIILEDCAPALRDDARRALARICLVSYRQMAEEADVDHRKAKKEVRQMIAQQLPYAGTLPRRNALLIRMISNAPWLFDGMYRIYRTLAGARR